MAICAASLKCLMMFCGCTPSSTKGLHSRRNSPARMTTVVVPSPTSESCDFAMSTRDLAAGCTMSRSFMIVAPSLEMVVVPRSSCTSLSSPRGPCGGMGGRVVSVSGGRSGGQKGVPSGGSGFFSKRWVRSGTHQGCADGVHDRHAGVDVGDELALALARVRALAQEHDLGLLLNRRGGRGRATAVN